MCLNPRLLLCKKLMYKGYEKTVIFWNTSSEEYFRGSATPSMDRLGFTTCSLLVRYGYTRCDVNGDYVVIKPLTFDTRIELPCRTCIQCTKARAKEWSIRCELEAQQFQDNYFVTLTYNDFSIPYNFHTVYDIEKDCNYSVRTPTLFKPHCTAFMKSLRQNYDRQYNHQNIRFFMCGEYGTKKGRPHYHYILFNLPIFDLEQIGTSKNGFPLYRSRFLEKSWKHGFVTIQKYSIETARYTAQYCCKKLNKKQSIICNKESEFINMSRRCGIGSSWFFKNFNSRIRVKDMEVLDKIYYTSIKNKKIETCSFKMPTAFLRYFKPVTDIKRNIDTEHGLLRSCLNDDNEDIFEILNFRKYKLSEYAENMLRVNMAKYGYDYEKDRFSEQYLLYLERVKADEERKFKIIRNIC